MKAIEQLTVTTRFEAEFANAETNGKAPLPAVPTDLRG
jgi:hypothetical protein